MDEYEVIDEMGVEDPAPGSPEAIAIRIAVTPDDGPSVLDTPSNDDVAAADLELLDTGAAEAAADVTDRRGPDDDDAEAWVNEVQGR